MTAAVRREVHHGRVTLCYAERPANLDAMLRAAAARAGGACAIVDGALRLDYRALDARVEADAGRLAGLGIVAGDRVAVLLENGVGFVAVMLAVARLGAILVPLGLRLAAPEIAMMLRDSGARLLLHEVAEDRLPADMGDCAALSLDRFAALDTSGFAAPAVDEDAPCAILYTSGTTGRPKGAVLTHGNVVHSCLHYAEHMGLADGERSMLAVPASHVTGLVAIVATMLLVAGRIVTMRAFQARRFLELAEAERATHTLMVPAMYALIQREPDIDRFDLTAWRIGGYGGAPMPVATIAALAAAWPGLGLVNCYGATETTSPAVIMPPGEGRLRPDAVGRAVRCGEIVAMDEAGREVPPGESGELWIAGPMVVPGYWQRAEADAASFVGGYWRSGDIGAIDAGGHVRILDRMKDMINRGGFKIYSAEVEDVLAGFPGVIEAAVVGRPCPVLGERVHAVIRADPPGKAAAVRAFVAARLADYKVPETIDWSADPLPRNANGKLVKASLREAVARG
ncbi:class I adenylate-forming enzyme family protein [Sphingomonas profundi]|uniref:class I adenylate-forming enzyme family protein n=1 Tax=Alterirhizorhabdus profundi TaxID=2681549 RepID=UPI0012E79576|nr:AMP-binding protein [Sphingomonas profundi]